MSLWIDLHAAFNEAYERNPPDEGLIRGIYDFARWCESAPRNSEPSRDPWTAVAYGFYEHLASHPAARADLHRWRSREEVESMANMYFRFVNQETADATLATLHPALVHHKRRGRPTAARSR
jgi:hypothetical protein